jgi:hypothetical protein
MKTAFIQLTELIPKRAPGPSVGHYCSSSRAFRLFERTHLHRCWYNFVPSILSTVRSLLDSSAFRHVSLGQEIDVVFTSQAPLVFRWSAQPLGESIHPPSKLSGTSPGEKNEPV